MTNVRAEFPTRRCETDAVLMPVGCVVEHVLCCRRSKPGKGEGGEGGRHEVTAKSHTTGLKSCPWRIHTSSLAR